MKGGSDKWIDEVAVAFRTNLIAIEEIVARIHRIGIGMVPHVHQSLGTGVIGIARQGEHNLGNAGFIGIQTFLGEIA